MSNYHIKNISSDGRKANVVFHIDVPVETNSASVALRTALSQHIDGSNFISSVPWLSAGDITALQNGEVYEHSEMITFPANATNAEKLTQLGNKFTSLSISVLGKVREQLKFWGYDAV